MSAKITLAVLVLLALLFVGGIALGSRSSAGTANVNWVESIGSLLSPGLDFSQLQGACVDQQQKSFVVAAGSSCVVSIPAVSKGTRKTTLATTGAGTVRVQYAAPASHVKIDPNDESAQQTVSLQNGKSASLVILQEGGNLTLKCQSGNRQPCQVTAK